MSHPGGNVGSKNIIPLEPDLRKQKAHSFQKVENGKYRLIRQVVVRDFRTGATEEETEIDDGLYEISDGDDFDEEVFYDDFDGSRVSVKFKKVQEEEIEEM
jgi:hypothetical protein